LVSSKLKKRFEAAVHSVITPLGRYGITPNILTVTGGVLATIAAYSYTQVKIDRTYLVISGALVIASGLIDAFDGVLARGVGKVTRFGGFFDSVVDRYSDAVIYSAIIASGLCDQWMGLVALTGGMLVSYTRARAEVEGIKMAGVGIAERAERMTFLSLCSIASYWYPPALSYGVNTLSLLSIITIIQRVRYFKKMIEKN